MALVLNNLQWLMCHKTQTYQKSKYKCAMYIMPGGLGTAYIVRFYLHFW